MKNYLLLFFLFPLLFMNCTEKSYSVSDWIPQQAPLELNCQSAVLMALDQEPPVVLFKKGESVQTPPASMTKLITAWLLLQHCAKENLSLETKMVVPAVADYRNLPTDSSLMFLKQGTSVSLSDLLSGLMVPSGNDAAYAVATFVSGGVSAFVSEMNQSCRALLQEYVEEPITAFVEPSGYDNRNRTTALEFAYLVKGLVDEFESMAKNEGKSILDFTGLESFTYNGVTQQNHNELIGRYDGVVGLKTGFINKSGANIALLAEQGETRFVAVMMGGPGENSWDRSLTRVSDASKLLTWGFDHFVEWTPKFEKIVPIGGKKKDEGKTSKGFEVELQNAKKILLSRDDYQKAKLIIDLPNKVSSKQAVNYEMGKEIGCWSFTVERNPIVLNEPICIKKILPN